MRNYLERKKLWKVVSEPGKNAEKEEAAVINVLLLTTASLLHDEILAAHCARDAWQDLELRFLGERVDQVMEA